MFLYAVAHVIKGHAGVRTPLDFYSHITPGLQEATGFDKMGLPVLEKEAVKIHC
jgi:hypothetical protein